MKNYVHYQDIVSHLDISRGDTLLVQSDIVKLLCVCREHKENFDANKFIDSILDKIGQDGTLLFPAFNFEFCSGKAFHYRNTVSTSGSLSRAALKRRDFIRTRHPIYSYAVSGFGSHDLYDLDNKSAFGSDSPFAYLQNNNAKQLTIGTDESFWYTKGYTKR